MLDVGETLVGMKTAKFYPSKFHDRYVDALRELIERKRKSKGARIEAEDEEETPRRASNVVDLMAALKKSIEKPGAKAETAKKAPARKAAPAKKAAPARKRA